MNSTLENIENEIKKIFFEVFPTLTEYEFNWKKKQNDYDNWDSFAQLNIITLIESMFNIIISDDESLSIKSAEDAVNLVKRHQ